MVVGALVEAAAVGVGAVRCGGVRRRLRRLVTPAVGHRVLGAAGRLTLPVLLGLVVERGLGAGLLLAWSVCLISAVAWASVCCVAGMIFVTSNT